MNGLVPTSISRDGSNGLIIVWSDGSSRRYKAGGLRDACPCATCREKKSAGSDNAGTPQLGKGGMLPVISLQEARPLTIQSMRPVGNYAYNIAFSDGHDSGIFTFDMLWEAGDSIVEPAVNQEPAK
jgi:DUF971 family protein